MQDTLTLSTATKTRSHPRVAVVLGLIGLRAAAAIPFFELFDEEQIEIDLLIGSSTGAWMTAMRGAGYSTNDMRTVIEEMRHKKFYSQIDFQTLFGFAHPKLAKPAIGSGLKKADRQKQLARRIFKGRRLEQLQPPTILQATDCLPGDPVALTEGDLADAVYAASAMGPFYPAQQIEGHWYVDGAYTRPVPIIEAIKRQADVIIALYHEEAPNPHPQDLLEANYNVMAAYFTRLIKDQTMLAIDLHHHEIVLLPLKLPSYAGPWDSKSVPQILRATEQMLAERRAEIVQIVRSVQHAAVV